MLAWQWGLFATALLLGLALVATLALYILEDDFIDRRLLRAEAAWMAGDAMEPAVRVLRPAELAEPHRTPLAGLAPGAMREFRPDPQRYLHVLALPPDAGGARLLAIDVQDEMRVSAGLARAAPLLLAVLLAVLAGAAWLARRFVRRVDEAMQLLLPAPGEAVDPDALRRRADRQPVSELHRFGHALADALEARHLALQREADTLRFLAHELRNPLQGAQLALSSLCASQPPDARLDRLHRSLQRLERASAAVLWLGEQAPAMVPVDVSTRTRTLCAELTSLAAQRGQTLDCAGAVRWRWAMPDAAADAVLGNLLLNAIQHGGPGPIRLRCDATGIHLANGTDAHARSAGHGLGLALARRLLARIDWTLDCSESASGFQVTLRPGSEAARAASTARDD